MIILFEEERAAFDRMIELIHQFQGGTAFLLWLSEGQLVTKGAYAKRSEDRFEKVGEYWIDNLKVFFGGAHFYLNCVEKSFIKNIVDREYEYKSLVSEFSKMKKKVIYDLLIGHTYTVIYQFHYAGKLCASCWTIYDMKNLLQVCKNRNVNFFT